jgi:predicted DNA-binding transcriptional regulator YafY
VLQGVYTGSKRDIKVVSWKNYTFQIMEPEVNPEEDMILFMIQAAIKMRIVIEFEYHGYMRVVEPYELGKNSRGDWIMRGFQVAGGGKRKGAGYWKHFRIDRMHNIDLTGQVFVPREDYYRLPPSWVFTPVTKV